MSHSRGSGTYHEIAEKLRLTAFVLGCATRKDLCARFVAVNPATYCDLDRLQKWFQGRALPRVPQFYDDWVKVLSLERSGTWLATCDPGELRAELNVGTDRQTAELWDNRPRREANGRAQASGIVGGARTFYGTYACYSHAWSPHFAGWIIRGSVQLRPGRGAALSATYSETLMDGALHLDGDVQLTARTLHFLVREPAGGMPLFFSFIVAGPPASVLCGQMSGVAFLANDTLPSACRVLMVRVPDTDALPATNGYIEAVPDFLSKDLAALGLTPEDPAALDRLAARFFKPELNQVTPADQAGFAALLDPAQIAARHSQAMRPRTPRAG